MPLTIQSQASRSKLHDPEGWISFYEFEVPRVPAARLRLCRWTRDVDFGQNTLGEPITYLHYDVSFADVEDSNDGNLQDLTIRISDVDPIVGDTIEDYDMTGQPVRVFVVHSAELNDPSAIAFDIQAKIRAINVDDEDGSVNLIVSTNSLYEIYMPSRVYARNACGHAYGDGLCQIDTTLAGMPQTCGKNPVACGVRGDVEVTNGLEKNHPRFAHFFPGIPLFARGGG